MKNEEKNINDNIFNEISKSGLDEFNVSESEINSINKKLKSRNKFGSKFKFYFSLFISIFILSLFVWYFKRPKGENKILNQNKLIIENKRVADSIVNDNQTLSSFIVAEEINEVVKSVESTRVEVRFKPIPMVKRDIQLVESNSKEEENLISFNVFVKRINQFLVVDYVKAGRYINKSDKSYLYQFNKEDADDSKTEKIDIELQLVKGLNFLEKNDYSSCIKNLNIIEDFFKDDLNVMFYRSYCYYKLGNYDYAIGGFNACINHKYNVFKEESEYYTALGYFGQGNIDEGKERLRDIINANGIYKNKAQGYLDAFNGK